MSSELISAESARLKRCEPRSGAGECNIGSGLALKHLADEDQLAAFATETDAIADHSLSEHGREFRREVAHLIGVGEENEIGSCRFDDLLEGDAIAVRSVGIEQVMFDEQNLGDVFSCEVAGERCDALANDECADGGRCRSGDLLRGGESLKARVVPFALA